MKIHTSTVLLWNLSNNFDCNDSIRSHTQSKYIGQSIEPESSQKHGTTKLSKIKFSCQNRNNLLVGTLPMGIPTLVSNTTERRDFFLCSNTCIVIYILTDCVCCNFLSLGPERPSWGFGSVLFPCFFKFFLRRDCSAHAHMSSNTTKYFMICPRWLLLWNWIAESVSVVFRKTLKEVVAFLVRCYCCNNANLPQKAQQQGYCCT